MEASYFILIRFWKLNSAAEGIKGQPGSLEAKQALNKERGIQTNKNKVGITFRATCCLLKQQNILTEKLSQSLSNMWKSVVLFLSPDNL